MTLDGSVAETASHRTIALFIPVLSAGGSERQLLELAKRMSGFRRDILILTMYDGGEFLGVARTLRGVRVVVLHKRNPLVFIARLIDTVRRERVDLIYAFLSSAQLYALAVKCFVPRVKLVCRIGDAIRPNEFHGRKNAAVNWALRIFARMPDLYVLNSSAAGAAKASALPSDRLTVVHNGIDTDLFRPDAALRTAFRCELGAADDVTVIGCLARFSVYKDQATFIAAARLIKDARANVRFVTIGDADTPLGSKARAQVTRLGLDSCFTFLGPRHDVERILPGCDVGCSSSVTEGFPNAVGEFMACGVPCVVTDVGDSSLLTGDAGWSVPRSNPQALAETIVKVLRLSPEERAAVGQRARKRIVENFSVARMVAQTEEILSSV